jgi:cyanoexosortase A
MVNLFVNTRYSSLGLIIAIATIYGTLLWRADETAHLGMSLLFGAAAASLLWDKRHVLKSNSHGITKLIALVILSIAVWQAVLGSAIAQTGAIAPLHTLNPAIRILPFAAAFGIGLFASGWKGLKQYWQEITILFFLGVPSIIAAGLPDLSPLTARFAGLLLYYGGLQAFVEGTHVQLSTGSVNVYAGCSGVESVTYLLGVSVVCLLLFPIKGHRRFFIPMISMFIAYFTNAARVAVLAIFVSFKNPSAFSYWHEGEGSLMVGAIAILLFCLFYFFLCQQEEKRSL